MKSLRPKYRLGILALALIVSQALVAIKVVESVNSELR